MWDVEKGCEELKNGNYLTAEILKYVQMKFVYGWLWKLNNNNLLNSYAIHMDDCVWGCICNWWLENAIVGKCHCCSPLRGN